MKRFFYFATFIFFLASLLILSNLSVKAQSDEPSSSGQSTEPMMAPDYLPPVQTEPGFFGQDQNYTVVFRGNGEAVVSAKIAFTNATESPLSEIKLRIPRVEPKEVFVYQVFLQDVCVRYNPSVYDSVTRSYPQQVCAQYQEPNYYQTYWGGARYQKASTNIDIDTLTIGLPKAIPANKSGAFFVYFRAFGYAKKSMFGSFTYTFESLKAEESVRNLRVGISTDSDLFLKGAKGEISYRIENTALQSFGKAGIAAPEANSAFDSYVSQIGYGSLVKNASNLAPLESYKVDGAYADSRLKLYGKEIATAAFVIVFLGTLLLLFVRFVVKKVSKANANLVKEENGKVKSDSPRNNSLMFLVSFGVSFASSIIILFYTISVFFIGTILIERISYQFQAIITLLLVVISFVTYSLLLFAPGVYMGVKKGMGWGIGTIVMTLIWIIIYFIVAVFIVFVLFGSTNSGPIIYGASKAG